MFHKMKILYHPIFINKKKEIKKHSNEEQIKAKSLHYYQSYLPMLKPRRIYNKK